MRKEVEEKLEKIKASIHLGLAECENLTGIKYDTIRKLCYKHNIRIPHGIDKYKQLKLQIVKEYETGAKISEIARKFDTDKTFITNAVKKYGTFKPRQVTKQWTKEEIDYLLANYENKFNDELAKDLNTTPARILLMMKRLKIKRSYKDPINLNLFTNITKPEIAYFLGYFYADGSIRGDSKAPALTIQKEDGLEIAPLIHSFGKVSQYEYKKKGKKDIITFKFYSRGLWTFLFEHDYNEKSTRSADKILSKIPEKLHHYFFRGLLDGDGCIYLNSKRNKANIGFYGDINQDWTFLESYLKQLDIKYAITKKTSEQGHKSSRLCVWGLEKAIPLLQRLYLGREQDKIGLTRKYSKFLELLNKTKNTIDYKVGIRRDIFYKKSDKNIVVSITDKSRLLPIKMFNNFTEAIEFKKKIIEEFNTLEFRLRKLIDYHDYSNQLNYLLEQDKVKSQSCNHSTDMLPK